ncbi:hypothetical protein I3760_09G211000 [Carya illinoinensis]|nr:hypothetical protein I3760_09G211000 [Carya illinoinensis]
MSLPASTSSGGTMKPPRGRLPLPVIIIIVCAVAFMALLYTETITFLSHSSIFRPKTCTRKNSVKKSNHDTAAENHDMGNSIVDDRFEFDPEECNVASGKWVFNRSIKPLYSDMSCPYLDRQVSCVKNGRPDSDYRHWEWQPEDCTLPRFNPEVALKKLRGKRLLFVGDSLQRGQWQSFVCMVESIIPEDQKFLRRGRSHTVFKAKEYNATIEFYWAPFLVESNSDINIIADPKKRILKVDSVSKHAQHWLGVDILVFNTYVWWMSGLRLKTLWGSFANGEEGFEELDTPVAYKIGLKTWANWVDSTINPNKTRVFFTTMSPTHTSRISSLQKRRLEQHRWIIEMFQRHKASDEKEALGKWFRQANNERGSKCSEENESSCNSHQHNTNLRVPSGCSLIRLHRDGGESSN